MPGAVLTTASQIMCPHGGKAMLSTKNTKTSAGDRMLLETDVHDVVGCPFTVGTKYQPCRKISWSAGASAVTVNETKVLVQSSIGQCKADGEIVQGVALIVQTQPKVIAR